MKINSSMLFLALTLLFSTANAKIWPQPKYELHQITKPLLYISPTISFIPSFQSPILTYNFHKYRTLIAASATKSPPSLHSTQILNNITIHIASSNDELSISTSYRYNITIETPTKAFITTDTIYGVSHALESLTQLFLNGSSHPVTIRDHPTFPWRGLMLDVGRRYAPVALIENLLTTMAAVKLSVLHLHASDYCRFSIESKIYPQLTSKLQPGMIDAGYYSQDDIKHLIQFAKNQGIRIVPEFDLPGHVYKWAEVLEATDTGLSMCNGTDHTIYNDAKNKSFQVLHALIGEMSALFADDVMHLGMDEVADPTPCTTNGTLSLEIELFNAVKNDFGKTIMGWNPISNVAVASAVNDKSKVIINSYMNNGAAKFVQDGFSVVDSESSKWYFTHPAGWDLRKECRPAGCKGSKGWDMCWNNPGGSNSTSGKSSSNGKVLGGEISMWTDDYIQRECGAHGSKLGLANASCFYSRKMDVGFQNSIGGLIWPRGIVAAGAFYNFNATLNASSVEFIQRIHQMNDMLAKRGSYVCQSNQVCSYVSEGEKYYDGIEQGELVGYSCSKQKIV